MSGPGNLDMFLSSCKSCGDNFYTHSAERQLCLKCENKAVKILDIAKEKK